MKKFSVPLIFFSSLLLTGCAAGGGFYNSFTKSREINCQPNIGDTFDQVVGCIGDPKNLEHEEKNTLGTFKIFRFGVRRGNWKTGIKIYDLLITFQDGAAIRIVDSTSK